MVLGILALASAAITVLGFGIAIWQILKVKGAAIAARDAVAGLAARVRSRELLAKLGDVHIHLEAARNHLASGKRDIAYLCLQISKASAIEANQLSRRVAGDWKELHLLIVMLREAEERLTVIEDFVQEGPIWINSRLSLARASETLQRITAQARYAYDLDEN